MLLLYYMNQLKEMLKNLSWLMLIKFFVIC
jgi:hypothetical protein